MKLEGRRALVTGATGGLGQAIARALSRRGARLVLSGRRRDVLDPLAEELEAETVRCDLSRPDEVDRLVEKSGDVDLLIANAALPASGQIDDFSVEEIDRALAVNLRAPILLAKEFAGRMAERGEGHIVFMSSLSGKSATPGAALYSATKFGIRGFALALRSDLRERGVGVSAVFPGPISEAGMWADTELDLPRLVRLKTPDDVAGAVVDVIERNRPEAAVASLPMRVGATFAGVAPRLAAEVNRRLGGEAIAADTAERQRSKR